MRAKYLPARFDIAPDSRPSAEEELLLRAALCPREEAITAWTRWVRTTGGVERPHALPGQITAPGWYDVAATVTRPTGAGCRLLPLVYRRLASFEYDDDQMPVLRSIYRDSWRVNQLVLHAGSQTLQLFADAGIPTIVLKGPALIELYYGDIGVRPMSDIDVLVPPEHSDAACRLLLRSGWTEKTGVPLTTLRVTHHAGTFVGEGGRELDLHWSAMQKQASDDAFWALARPIDVHGVPTLALSPTDQLLHVVVHGTGRFAAPVRWVADAMTILECAGDQIAWSRLADEAIARGMALRLASGLRYLERTFHTPVPQATITRLGAAHVTLSEWLAHLALTHPPRHGGDYVDFWDRWRQVRALGLPGAMPANYLQYVQWQWNLTSRRQFARRLLDKAVQIVRTGHSDPGLVQPSVPATDVRHFRHP